MQQWIEFNSKLANEGYATLKKMGEINLQATESLLAQQKEAFDTYTVSAKANMESLTATKEPKDLLDLQSKLVQESMTSMLGIWKKSIATANTSRDAYSNLTEETMKAAKSNMEESAKSVKKTSEAIKKAVKTATKKA